MPLRKIREGFINGYRVYVDIMTGEKLSSIYEFRLLTWTKLIGQFVHPVGGEGIG